MLSHVLKRGYLDSETKRLSVAKIKERHEPRSNDTKPCEDICGSFEGQGPRPKYLLEGRAGKEQYDPVRAQEKDCHRTDQQFSDSEMHGSDRVPGMCG